MLSVEQARRLAAGQLARALPRRWRHVQAVGAKAERIGPPLVGKDAPVLTAAAWLHDVGYAPALAETGRVMQKPPAGIPRPASAQARGPLAILIASSA